MLNEIKVGSVVAADGVLTTARGGRTGATITCQAHGDFAEPAMRGTIFEVCNAVAGVAPGTVQSAAPPISLWNPPSSGKYVAIIRVSMGYVSGTLGAGSIIYGAVPAQNTVPTTGTELTPNCALIGMPRGVARAFTGSTYVQTPTPLRTGLSMGAFLATTALQPWNTKDLVDSSIVLAPGTAFSMQGLAAAGTSPIVIFGIVYEEISI